MMILTAVKMKFVDQAIEKLPTGNQESIIIKRNAAMRFEETGKIDHEGKHTIYAQIWRQMKKKNDNNKRKQEKRRRRGVG